MHTRLLSAAVLAAAVVAACGNPLGRQYEYDEQIYLSVDGSATVVVNASLPALVALRGASVDPRVDGTADRNGIRRLYESAGCSVRSVGRFWHRRGRRYVQIQVQATDVRTLSKCALTAWSSYTFSEGPLTESEGTGLRYTQTVGAPVPGDPGAINWDGTELVAVKLHAPSRITWQNVKKLDGTNGTTERGNILTWEQRLTDRRAGVPIAMVVEMEPTSILYTTIWLFLGAFAAAVFLILTLIWWAVRRGRRQQIAANPPDSLQS